jgi:hypothetical protein
MLWNQTNYFTTWASWPWLHSQFNSLVAHGDYLDWYSWQVEEIKMSKANKRFNGTTNTHEVPVKIQKKHGGKFKSNIPLPCQTCETTGTCSEHCGE